LTQSDRRDTVRPSDGYSMGDYYWLISATLVGEHVLSEGPRKGAFPFGAS
jgi:hypothetical protein